MDNTELIEEINYWDSILKTEENLEIIELAFFKIYIKFEKFASNLFLYYSIGQKSSKDYCPNRKLIFIDEKHFEGLVKRNNSSYIDYFVNMYDLSDHIFIDNPFEIITKDAYYSTDFLQMKFIRNYIAHESPQSKKKYKESLLNGREFIKPSKLLIENKKNKNITYYSYYVDVLKKSSEYLLSGSS